MRVIYLLIIATTLLASCTPNRPAPPDAPIAASTAGATRLPGGQSDGSVLLPNQWSLRPVGKQVELRDFPVNVAVEPSGRFAAVLHAGFSRHQILMVDLVSAQVVSHTDLNQGFYGLEFSPDGKLLFCSGAGEEVVHSFQVEQGNLTGHQVIKLRDPKQRGVVAGLAVDKASQHLYAANVFGHRVTRVDLGAEPRVTDFLLGTNAAQLSVPPVKPSADFDTAAANKRAEASLYAISPGDAYPYACRLDEKRQRLYVSLWAQAAVAVLDSNSGRLLGRWPAQEHPCEMVLDGAGRRLFVANAARNSVTIFDTERGKATETLQAALYPNAPPGSTPNSVALTPDEKTLFVANADNNILAVFDVSLPGKTRSLGFIPVGWYPTSVRVTPDGRHLLVANGKGIVPKANPLGPQPGRNNTDTSTVEYIARLFRGTLSVIELPSHEELPRWLAGYTEQAFRCSPLRADLKVTAARPERSPIPSEPGGSTPIRYCLYIVKENRTYDQVLGDLTQGNGDPKLCLFPEQVTPNHHALARQFVLLDNFFVESEVSADGHEWTMGAYATDFVEKTWPLNYGHNRLAKFPYPSEGNFPIAYPAGGYLWDKAREAGVSYRSYGEFFELHGDHLVPGVTRVKSLQGHIDEAYRGFDLNYPDVNRADRFISELKRFEAIGEMPRLQILRLGNDHTHGATPGQLTPRAMVADNDLALGRVIEAVSHSRFWPSMAIFVVEDDAQNGPDHVDAHRTIAFAISPYIRRGTVDSTLYSTSSMLRTMELLLGLKPMSQFDAAAAPMFGSFQPSPDLRAYSALPANIDLKERNGARAWGGNQKMDFSRADAVDDMLLNEVIWRSVRGPDSPMPAPTRAGFVFTRSSREDD